MLSEYWFDLIMSSILLMLLVGGLLTGFYLYHSVRTFVAQSQLPLPVISSRPQPLPRTDQSEGPYKAPSENDDEDEDEDENEGTSDPLSTAVAREEGESDSNPTERGPEAKPTEEVITLLNTPVVEGRSSKPEPFVPDAATERLTLLVMGIDRREEEQQGPWRTDSMILISINPEDDSIAMLSTPRDLFVTIPNYGEGEYRNRINTAFYFGDLADYPGGGPALAMATIRRNFGIQVDRYLVLDFNGFERIIDAIGGIEIDVPKQIVDTRYPTEDYGYMTVRFEPGLQMMGGERALIYSRTRKSTSDFDRAARQQQVILAVRDRVLSLDLISSLTPTKLSQLIFALDDSIQTDMTFDEVFAFAKVANRIEEKGISRLVIDPNMVSDYTTGNGARVLLPNWDIILPLTQEVLGMPLLAIAPHPAVPFTWYPSPTPVLGQAPLTLPSTPIATRVTQATFVIGEGTPWPTWTPVPSDRRASATWTPANGTPWATWTPANGTPWATWTPANGRSLATRTAANGTPLATRTAANGTPLATRTPENGRSLATWTPANGTRAPANGTPLATWTPANGTPLATWTPANGTPLATWTPANGTPLATWTPANGTPLPTWTPANGTPLPTWTPENGVPLPTWTPENGTPLPTWTPENGAPLPTWTPENGAPLPLPTWTPENGALPTSTPANGVPLPTWTPANGAIVEPTPLPEDSSYEPTAVIEELVSEPTAVIEELSYEATPTAVSEQP